MAVLRTKPHILSYLATAPGQEDDNGDYEAGVSQWEGCIPCDAVPATGSAREEAFSDGVARSYSYVVYLPASCRHFAVGDIVRLFFSDGTVNELSVKGFRRWQHQCKMWV